MSRIGKKPILLPERVTAKFEAGRVLISGPKGELEMKIPAEVEIKIIDKEIWVSTTAIITNLQGVVRAVLNNMVKGVVDGWIKVLELSGTGFKAAVTGNELNLSLGFSHPVKVIAPKGITFEVKENKITVLGIDKIVVGEIAAKIRKFKPADVYKHKGLKYEGEKLIKKAGKAAKAGAPGAK